MSGAPLKTGRLYSSLLGPPPRRRNKRRFTGPPRSSPPPLAAPSREQLDKLMKSMMGRKDGRSPAIRDLDSRLKAFAARGRV